MNILIPHSWLLDYLESKVTPKKLAECISLCGPSAEEVKKVGDDWVYDFEVTTNRVDMMSVLGIAREAAAILPQFNIAAKLKKDPYNDLRKPLTKGSLPIKIVVKDQKLCPRSTALVFDNIKIKPSSKLIQDRLEKTGIRSLNNIIDISNYLMRELGQPVHVFDYDKIAKATMIMRAAKKGETITTLDDQKYRFNGGEIIIEDGDKRIIDFCGIMGGAKSAIDKQTKRVLLFVQTYEPKRIRQASMSLGIRTEAAQLFEKNPNPEGIIPTIKRGIQLIKELSGGRVASQLVDIYHQPMKPKSVKASLQLIKVRLGVDISSSEVKKILQPLGLKVKSRTKNELTITVPPWRNKDINIPEDIVEEVARIYGYHRLPSQLMETTIPTNYPDENFVLEQQIKTHLVGLGFFELYTNSLVSEKLINDSPFNSNKHLKIKNALSEEWLYLRRSIIPSHLEAIQNNPNQKQLQFFEMANVYHPQKGKLPQEQLQLVITTTNSYQEIKGVVELLLRKLHLKAEFKPQNKKEKIWLQGKTARILVNKQVIGTLGGLKLSQDYCYKKVNAVVFDLRVLLKLSQNYPKYQPLSTHPPIIEDLTFTLPIKTYVGLVIKTIKKADKLIKKVELTKTYQQNYTFTITYQSTAKDLTNQTITPIRKKIVNRLSTSHFARLVGKLD